MVSANTKDIQADFKRLVRKYYKQDRPLLIRWYFEKYQSAGGKLLLTQILKGIK